MKKLYEVSVRYTDGTEETLLIDVDEYEAAKIEAESWVDFKKDVLDITVVREVCVREIKRRA